MPRGTNPNSLKNLIVNSDLTPEERRKKASKMGKASGESRAILRTFKEMSADDSPEEKAKMWQMLKKRAMQGNLKAFEIYRDTIGEKPVDELNVSGQLTNPYSGLTEEELRRLAGGDCE